MEDVVAYGVFGFMVAAVVGPFLVLSYIIWPSNKK